MANVIYNLEEFRERNGFSHSDLRDHDEVLPPVGVLFEQGVLKLIRSVQSLYESAEGCYQRSSQCAASSYKCGQSTCKDRPVAELLEDKDLSIDLERQLLGRIPVWKSYLPQLEDRELLQAHLVDAAMKHLEAHKFWFHGSDADCTCSLIEVVESIAPDLLHKDALGRTGVVDACARIADDIRDSGIGHDSGSGMEEGETKSIEPFCGAEVCSINDISAPKMQKDERKTSTNKIHNFKITDPPAAKHTGKAVKFGETEWI